MSFLFCGNIAKSPATYLVKGLFPTLSRYLSGNPRYATKQSTGAASTKVLTEAQEVIDPDGASAEEQGLLEKGITGTTIKEGPLAEQHNAPRFISPHPLVTFAEAPVVCGARSFQVVAAYTPHPERPLFLQEVVSPSLKSPQGEVESSPAMGSVNTPAQRSRPDLSACSGLECRKRFNLRSLPALPLTHSRDVSTSSNETLICSPRDLSSSSSPVISHFGQTLQDAAVKVIRGKQADKVHELEQVVREMRVELAYQEGRADELQTDLEICERDRELNLNAALRLYQNPGNSVMIERRNLIDQIDQLKSEVLNREEAIWSRDQLIESLRVDIARYANDEQWVHLRQCYFALQQQYGQMPQDFNRLKQKYEDLEDEYIDLSNRFKQLEGDHTELKAQRDQIRDERDKLEDDVKTSKQSSQEAEARYWALEVQFEELKPKSEKGAGTKERFLVDLAARMFKRTMSMARILVGTDVDPMDAEQIALCQIAQIYLGLSAEDIASSFEKAGSGGNREFEDERVESNLEPTHVDNVSASMSTSESNKLKPTVPITEATAGQKEPGSHDTSNARRLRGAAAAEEEIPGPLELGSRDGEGSQIFHDLGESTETVNKETNTIPSLPQEAFSAPRFEDLNFGSSSGGVPVFGSENKSSGLPEPISEPVSPGIFNVSSISSAQAPRNTYDPPRFGQDFKFDGSNGKVSSTANQQAFSSPLAPVNEVLSASTSSCPYTSFAQEVPSVLAQAKEKTTEEETSDKDTVEKEVAEENAPNINTRSKKNSKSKKAKKEDPRKRSPRRGSPKCRAQTEGSDEPLIGNGKQQRRKLRL